jgi:hypothetical protein
MSGSRLAEFLRDAGDRPYRELVEHHLRRGSERQLRDAAVGEVLLLPADLQPHATKYIDVVGERLGCDRAFWATATCRTALDRVVDAAFDSFPIPATIPSKVAIFEPEHQDLAFQFFQIGTLSIAYSASSQRAQRRFMGIRRGLFG